MCNILTLPSSPQVVYNVGLCICLYDITKLDDSYIFPGDGASHTKGTMMLSHFLRTLESCVTLTHLPLLFLSVHFRYVVFHPFLDEILLGKIKYCSQEGVHGKFLSDSISRNVPAFCKGLILSDQQFKAQRCIIHDNIKQREAAHPHIGEAVNGTFSD